jgi:hypothetical protein
MQSFEDLISTIITANNKPTLIQSLFEETGCISLNSIVMGYTIGFPLSRDFSNFQVPALLDFFSPGTTGPSRSLGPVLSSPGT